MVHRKHMEWPESVQRSIEQVAKGDVTVLLLGESGTGKELVAETIHRLSKRSKKPFVPVNCGAIPVHLFESDLFGHRKGAFTGAVSDHKGRIESASGGTLFLDEIGDMPLDMQVKLLRVLQDLHVEPVGDTRRIPVDVRIIAATNQNLQELVTSGRFRIDLFYRINVFPITMPPMRERVDAIPLLLEQLRRNKLFEVEGLRLTQAAVMALCHYHWPGNVRELLNLLERLQVLYPTGKIDICDLPAEYQPDYLTKVREPQTSFGTVPKDNEQASEQLHESERIGFSSYINQMERRIILSALEGNNWVVSRAAQALQMQRTTLIDKIRKHALVAPKKGD